MIYRWEKESRKALSDAGFIKLRARIRANCCPFHGLTPTQFERHIYQIEQTVLQARKRGRW